MTRPRAVELLGISDLHLPAGPTWCASSEEWERLRRGWHEQLTDDSVLLMAGDQVDASARADIAEHYAHLATFPGTKVLIPGNHDLRGVRSGRALRQLCEGQEKLIALLGTAVRLELPGRSWGLVVAGTVGASAPAPSGGPRMKASPGYKTEVRRLRSALSHARQLRREGDALVLLLHYPPCGGGEPQRSPLCRMIREADVDLCIYGHAHAPSVWPRLFQGRYGPTRYRFVAADYQAGRLRQLGSIGERRLRVFE